MTSKQEIYEALGAHLMQDKKPSAFIAKQAEEPTFREYPLIWLLDLKSAEQSPEHHPEGNVWNHTMLVVDEAAKVKEISKDPSVFMWAALLHDIGKPDTTKIRKGKITSYDHDKLGAEMTAKFLMEFTDDYDFILKVAALVRWHMQILFVVNRLPFADIPAMKQNVDFHEVALLGLCDRMGRKGADRAEEDRNIHLFLDACEEK